MTHILGSAVGGSGMAPESRPPLLTGGALRGRNITTITRPDLKSTDIEIARGCIKIIRESTDAKYVAQTAVTGTPAEFIFGLHSKEILRETEKKLDIMNTTDRYDFLDVDFEIGAKGVIFVPRATEGDLEKRIAPSEKRMEKGGLDLTWKERLQVGKMILQAAEQLHKAGYAHGDLKPENFLVYRDPNGKLRIRLADFGKAEKVEGVTSYSLYTGNTLYGAPEGQVRKESDIYGFGLCLVRALEEAFLTDTKNEEAVMVPVEEKKGIAALEKRRGIERFVLEHPDCQRTSDHKFVELTRRAKVAMTRVEDIASSPTLKREQEVIHGYIDALCDRIRDKKLLSDESAESLRGLLTSMTERDPLERPTATVARMWYEKAILRPPKQEMPPAS